ncbi:MAG TPA: retropepsin-like aspartic protease [Ktedonobacterales bacterium]|nr:retropepsin-like aspartic protease [Ktedonobacterales bacterium]
MSMHQRFGWQTERQQQFRPSLVVLLILSFVLLLSLSACSVTIGNAPASTTTGPGISEQVQVVQDQSGATLVLAPVTIHGKGPFTFAVDTGASTSLISSAVAQQLGLPVAGSAEPISGIGGVTQAVPVKVSDWNTGSIRLPSVTIASAAIPHERGSTGFQGLLGSDIWSKFGKFTLDYSSSTLTVYQQIALAPADRRLALVWFG